jgi:hypothetical protein
VSGHEAVEMAKTHVFYALLGALVLSGCSWGLDGNGHRVERERQLDAFSRIRSDAELDVLVTQADAPSLTVSIDSNLQHLVKTYVERDVLHIDVDAELDDFVRGPHVMVTVPKLEAAKLDGSGTLSVEIEQPELPFDLYLDGSGSARFRGHTAALGGYLGGSGELRLSGETSDVTLELSGSGDIDATHLQAESGRIELSGSGEISANVSESVSVSLSGSGEIELFGGAHVDEYRHDGSGDFVER